MGAWDSSAAASIRAPVLVSESMVLLLLLQAVLSQVSLDQG